MQQGMSPARNRKVLGRLETSYGEVICCGGAQFDEDGSGFFIPEMGGELRSVWFREGVVRTVAGEVIPVADLEIAVGTISLPRRYTFMQKALACAQKEHPRRRLAAKGLAIAHNSGARGMSSGGRAIWIFDHEFTRGLHMVRLMA